jgi:hypothetical protein
MSSKNRGANWTPAVGKRVNGKHLTLLNFDLTMPSYEVYIQYLYK